VRLQAKALIKARGDNSFGSLRRAFKLMDQDGSGFLNADEFKWGLLDFGLVLTDTELQTIVSAFDINKDGSVSFDEFMRVMRGELNERRRAMVDLAFAVMDKDGSGVINISDVAAAYNVDMHPKVRRPRVDGSDGKL
jgi:calcyphosin